MIEFTHRAPTSIILLSISYRTYMGVNSRDANNVESIIQHSTRVIGTNYILSSLIDETMDDVKMKVMKLL